jgi:hypothetical protein
VPIIVNRQAKHVLHVRVCSTSTTVTSGNGIILMLSANVSSLLQHQHLGWYRRGHCLGPLSADCSTTSSFAGNCSTRATWRCASSCEAEFVVSAQRSSSTLWVRCPAVAEHDISRKADWTWRVDCMASSVTRSNSDGFFSCGDTWRRKFTQSLPGLSKISWQDFKQLWQRSMPTC